MNLPVEPELGLREDHVGQLPHGVEALGGVGLGEDVVEPKLQKMGGGNFRADSHFLLDEQLQ